jgi:Tfp pilus assembly protein FimT
MLIVVVIVAIIVKYVLGQISTIRKPFARTNAALRLMTHVQNARSDSIRRHASELNRMAQITVLDAHGYNVSLDANGDGALDPPVFVDLKEQNLRIDGPFPRMYMFDAQGRTVDPGRNPIPSAAITLFNGSGKSVINVANLSPSSAKSGSNR